MKNLRKIDVFGRPQSWEILDLGLIRTFMAPNLDPRASPGSFFQAGSPGSHQIQPSCQKWTEIFRDSGRDFRIFRIFPKWKTATLVGQDSAWEVQKRYFRPKNLVFLAIFGNFPLFGGSPGVPPSLLLAPLGHLTVFNCFAQLHEYLSLLTSGPGNEGFQPELQWSDKSLLLSTGVNRGQ